MSSVRQQARRRALKAQATRRGAERERERRRSKLAVDVTVALDERDAAIVRHENRAALALKALVESEVVPVVDLSAWVPGLTATEARRLLREYAVSSHATE